MSKLRLYIEDADQNLKYLGLLSLSKILRCQPKAVLPHKSVEREEGGEERNEGRMRERIKGRGQGKWRVGGERRSIPLNFLRSPPSLSTLTDSAHEQVFFFDPFFGNP